MRLVWVFYYIWFVVVVVVVVVVDNVVVVIFFFWFNFFRRWFCYDFLWLGWFVMLDVSFIL